MRYLKIERITEDADGILKYRQQGPIFNHTTTLWNYAKSVIHPYEIGDYLVREGDTESPVNVYGIPDDYNQGILLVDWLNEFERITA